MGNKVVGRLNLIGKKREGCEYIWGGTDRDGRNAGGGRTGMSSISVGRTTALGTGSRLIVTRFVEINGAT